MDELQLVEKLQVTHRSGTELGWQLACEAMLLHVTRLIDARLINTSAAQSILEKLKEMAEQGPKP